MNSAYDVNEWRFCFISSLLANYYQTPAQPLFRRHVPQSRGCSPKRGSTVYKRSGTTRVSYFLRFPDQVLSGDLFRWRGCWGYGWFPDRVLYYLQFSCVYRPLWYSAGSLVALYNGQCMMTCITKMISDRRWQRGLSYEHVFSVSQACPFSVVAWKRSRK